MKAKDIKVGDTYLTTVSGRKVKVVVTGVSDSYGHGFQQTVKGPKRFHVGRVDNGDRLPKARTAAALSEAPVLNPMYEVRDGSGQLVTRGRSGKGHTHVAEVCKAYCGQIGSDKSELTVVPVRVDNGVHEFKVMRGDEERGILRVSKVES